MAIDSSVQRIARLTPLSAILALIEEQVAAVAARRTALAEAVGAALASDVYAAERPAHAIALRDGFAVAAAEIADAGPYAPVPLSLIARRIDAGEALPSGTDAVAPLDAIALRGDRTEAVAVVAPCGGIFARARCRRHGCGRHCRSDNPLAADRTCRRKCGESAGARRRAGSARALSDASGLLCSTHTAPNRGARRQHMRRRDRHRRHR